MTTLKSLNNTSSAQLQYFSRKRGLFLLYSTFVSTLNWVSCNDRKLFKVRTTTPFILFYVPLPPSNFVHTRLVFTHNEHKISESTGG